MAASIESIVRTAREVPPAERAAYLEIACRGDAELRARVNALLAAEADDATRTLTPLPADATQVLSANSAALPAEHAGQTIDRYTLVDVIGEGGFGAVWLAEQREPVKRRVALKIIKLGMDTREVITRFEAERQALAMMDHPNIAKVHDAGSTDTGRPYFVMELVKGVSILEYCDTERLDTRARLELFMTVCGAIQHAHQKGIIHRDIKPSNVLATMQDGRAVPKVIDFGIAKATGAALTQHTLVTRQQQIIGTPAYMSPEQANLTGLDIDTRSDIYALGVLLYELLTGTTPFDSATLVEGGISEMMRIIREQEPHKPSTRLSALGDEGTTTASRRRVDVGRLRTLLRGDLDWIVMKCLEKDRTRRYETANGLAEDIRRHLEDQPVTAGPPSSGYRVKKFVRRNRAGVLGGAAVGAAVLLGLAGTTWGLLEARAQGTLASKRADEASLAREREAQRADEAVAAREREADRARELQQVADFQSQQFGVVVPDLMGARLRDAIVAEAPEAERDDLRRTLGRINFTTIGVQSLETNLFAPSVAATRTQFAEQPLVEAQLLQSLAERMRDLGLLDAAVEPQARAIALRRGHLGDDHPATLMSLDGVGQLALVRGRLDEAEAAHRDAFERRRSRFREDHVDTLTSLSNLGTVLEAAGKLDEAVATHRESVAAHRRALGDDHPNTVVSLGNLAHILLVTRALDEAETVHRESLEAHRRVFGDDSPDTLTSLNNLGGMLQTLGAMDEAETCWREALAGRRRVLGDDHPDTLNSLNNLGFLLHLQGKRAEAEPYWRQAYKGRQRVLGDDHPATLTSLNNLGFLLRVQGKLDDAEAAWVQALDGHRRVLGDDHIRTLVSLNNLAELYNAQERFVESETLAREASETGARVLGPAHWRAAEARSLLGEALAARGAFNEAEPLLLESYAAIDAALPSGPRREQKLVPAAQRLVGLYEAWGKPAEADAWRTRPDGADPTDG
jgi:tetratricopeptide (TPR) repeat protein